MEDMAGALHISEAEAAKNLAAVLDRADAGDVLSIERTDGSVLTLIATGASERSHSGRTVGEAIEILRSIKAKRPLTRLDDKFATDMEKIHEEMNTPLDHSKWG